jgi:hypothetical protein
MNLIYLNKRRKNQKTLKLSYGFEVSLINGISTRIRLSANR